MRPIKPLGALFVVAIHLAPVACQAQQGASFGRVSSVRRQAMSSPAAARSASQVDPLRPYSDRPVAGPSYSLGSPGRMQPRQRPVEPRPGPSRVSQHSYYPGIRSGRSINQNVPREGQPGGPRCHASRAGMMTGMSAGGFLSLGQSPR